jgi:hypothetical protein
MWHISDTHPSDTMLCSVNSTGTKLCGIYPLVLAHIPPILCYVVLIQPVHSYAAYIHRFWHTSLRYSAMWCTAMWNKSHRFWHPRSTDALLCGLKPYWCFAYCCSVVCCNSHECFVLQHKSHQRYVGGEGVNYTNALCCLA